MISFSDWNKNKEKNTDYEIVQSRSGLPMFVLPPPVKKKKSVPQMVSDFISSNSH